MSPGTTWKGTHIALRYTQVSERIAKWRRQAATSSRPLGVTISSAQASIQLVWHPAGF